MPADGPRRPGLLQMLQDWILSCALNFVKQVQGYQCDGLQVISSWLNWADVGAGQLPHSHENSWIVWNVLRVL